MLQRMFLLVPAIVLTIAAGQAQARCGGCVDPCGYASPCGGAVVSVPCEVQYVEKTVHVPVWVTETRKVMVTEYKHEPRERTVIVHKVVPETKQVTKEYTVMVPTKQTKQVEYTVCVPVTREVTKEYTVKVPVWREVTKDVQVQVCVKKEVEQEYTEMVPHKEPRQGVRRVCKVVPVVEKCVVTRDRGHWGEQVVQVPCGRRCHGCGDCGTVSVIRKCWVPNLVQEEVEVTRHRKVVEEVPYEYHVVVCKPVVKTRTVTVCDYETVTKPVTYKVCDYETQTRTKTYTVCETVQEKRVKDVTYVVCVPEKRVKTYDVTVCKTVPTEVKQTYTVCVPYEVEKEVQVRVCKTVAKTIQVPVYGHCGYGCGPRYHGCWRRGC